MNEMMKKLMEKKKEGKPLPKEYKSAKLGVLKDLHDEMGKMAGEGLSGMKKVTVASPDEEGLKVGLDKAKEVLGEMPESEEDPFQDLKMDVEKCEDVSQIDELMKLLEAKKIELAHKE